MFQCGDNIYGVLLSNDPHPTIQVDYAPEHEAAPFNAAGDPILAYRSTATTGATRDGKPRPDGWVLFTADGEEFITGLTSLTDVDRAVADAEDHLLWLRETQERSAQNSPSA
ncbi:Uncharacterised protein [Mycolicibacterium chitae]|uniref:Uncharacterized protein n=1 Tax=Mycolicibacterium chitae TaxID=1792 RepID=A0A3S4VCB5_MYCCI|nr:Uncharacterised protein [Mycolicibacterium chitae]